MAVIVDFPGKARRASDRSRTQSAGAEIVLFPGVRYEYWEEKPPRQRKSRRSVAERDLMEIDA